MRKNLVCFLIVLAGVIFAPVSTAYSRVDATTSPFVYPEYSKTISMDFQEASLVDVLKIFSKQTHLNLITSESIAASKITMYLDEVPVEQALEQLLRANNLTYEIQPGSNIYIVKPLTRMDDELVTRVYAFKHALVSTSKLSDTTAIVREDGQLIGATVPGTDASGIIGAIEGILSPKGKVVEDARTNSVVVTDVATNFANIERTIARLDIMVPQILIEVEMLEVTKGVTEKLGVKMGDTPFSFTGAYRKTLYPFHQGRILDSGIAFESNVIDDDKTQYYAGTLNFSGLTATLQFLKSQTGTKSLARPRILTLSNEPAQIKIATNEAIGKKEKTSVDNALSSSTAEAERVETGVFLTVTPQANLATNDITMAIIPKVIQARTGGTFDGITYKDPELRGTQSILRVKSGETIIMGGLMREERSTITTKVPFLGDIPLLGQAFRHKDETVTEKELIVFITPHILTEETAAVPLNAPDHPVIIREQDFPARRSELVAEELANFEKTGHGETVN